MFVFTLTEYLVTLKVLVFTLKVLVFALKVLVFTLKVLVFALKVLVFALKVLVFTLKVLLFTLKATHFDLSYLPRHSRRQGSLRVYFLPSLELGETGRTVACSGFSLVWRRRNQLVRYDRGRVVSLCLS